MRIAQSRIDTQQTAESQAARMFADLAYRSAELISVTLGGLTALGAEPPEAKVMRRPQRPRSHRIATRLACVAKLW